MEMVIHIDLGNEAMQTPRDVADAIVKSLDHEGYHQEPLKLGDEVAIRDENGNTVGTWTIVGRARRTKASWGLDGWSYTAADVMEQEG